MGLPIAGIIGGVAGGIGISGLGWVSKNVLGTGEWLEQIFEPKISTPKTPTTNSSVAAFATEQHFFRVQVLAPSNDNIKAIDDFFESYGYRVNKFATPKLNVRSTFTYVKTKEAVVFSSNTNAAKQLSAMLNSGCKFWNDKIGDEGFPI